MLGANDGIVSTAGLVLGVAGATTNTEAILVAGLAGLVAGALSMAAGEYVSVSSQRDIEQSAVAHEQQELADHPEQELAELASVFESRGLSAEVAHEVAVELTQRDAVGAHTREEYGIEPGAYLNPWAAGVSSLVAFTVGALLPLLGMALFGVDVRVAATFAAVLVALVVTGYVSARLGGAAVARAVERFPFLRKSTGHLLSKHRFVAAQLARTIDSGAWIHHAAHANAMAAHLAAGLAARGLAPAFPCEANGVFVALPPAIDAGLQARGHGYYPFASPVGLVSRLMCSFDTQPAAVDALLADVDALRG